MAAKASVLLLYRGSYDLSVHHQSIDLGGGSSPLKMMRHHQTGPAAKLQPGDVLGERWIIQERTTPSMHSTGGWFSATYSAKDKQGNFGFVKAMDFHEGLDSKDPAKAIEEMTQSFIFERDVLEYCKEHRLSRVIKIIEWGVHRPKPNDLASVVQYLVFEPAQGDIRAFIANSQIWERALALRTIHGVAAALQQLHRVRVAHQDVKPSNILMFEDGKSKLADLGRAFRAGVSSPHQNFRVAGDKTYAPPEGLYGDRAVSWDKRRAACDMYLLGSLIVFILTRGSSLTGLLFSYMDDDHHPRQWKGSYEEVLPYVTDAFDRVLLRVKSLIDNDYVSELNTHIRQLCHPDIMKRGHPINIGRGHNQYSLERYVSIFDRLASRAEFSLKRHGSLGRG